MQLGAHERDMLLMQCIVARIFYNPQIISLIPRLLSVCPQCLEEPGDEASLCQEHMSAIKWCDTHMLLLIPHGGNNSSGY